MYNVEIGETLRIPLLIVSGNKDLVTDIRANLKLAGTNGTVPAQSTPVAATFNILPAIEGWILELPANVTKNLVPGLYVVNAALEVTGTTVITSPQKVKVSGSTTL